MLALFPELLFLAPFSALLIRLSAALIFGYVTYRRLREPSILARGTGALEGVCSVLLFWGLYAQGAALLGITLSGLQILSVRFRILPMSTMLLTCILCLSLLVTGAGPFTVTLFDTILPLSFDLPL